MLGNRSFLATIAVATLVVAQIGLGCRSLVSDSSIPIVAASAGASSSTSKILLDVGPESCSAFVYHVRSKGKITIKTDSEVNHHVKFVVKAAAQDDASKEDAQLGCNFKTLPLNLHSIEHSAEAQECLMVHVTASKNMTVPVTIEAEAADSVKTCSDLGLFGNDGSFDTGVSGPLPDNTLRYYYFNARGPFTITAIQTVPFYMNQLFYISRASVTATPDENHKDDFGSGILDSATLPHHTDGCYAVGVPNNNFHMRINYGYPIKDVCRMQFGEIIPSENRDNRGNVDVFADIQESEYKYLYYAPNVGQRRIYIRLESSDSNLYVSETSREFTPTATSADYSSEDKDVHYIKIDSTPTGDRINCYTIGIYGKKQNRYHLKIAEYGLSEGMFDIIATSIKI